MFIFFENPSPFHEKPLKPRVIADVVKKMVQKFG